MQSMSANEAKTHFGDLLIRAQHEPIQINKNNKSIAIVISIHEYQHLEDLKNQFLQFRLEHAKAAIASGQLIDGDSFVNDVIDGKFD